MIKAFILDLDNTIYPAPSIAHIVFKPIYQLLEEHQQEIGKNKLPEIKMQMNKKAWQKIAEEHGFNDELTKKGADILRETEVDIPMQAFSDYELVKPFEVDKFLVTMGFTKMQEGKIKMLNLDQDFKETSVNDPEKSEDTKKEVFESILKRHGYKPEEVLVIGDDPDSEIKAGKDLGTPTVLYDRQNEFKDEQASHRIQNFAELEAIVAQYNHQ
ncbi:HAD family hydrolase [Mucilaginibacter sp. PAMB04168]|uniref:HAD family hydrolase n=1 Tax=Mucilaginibacter sp. PAMB04168 TaxID=3138567 RepID=UPI0031F602C3